MGGLRPFQRRSFLQGVAGGLAGAVAAGSMAPGVARAATQDGSNMEATREGLRAVPFHGRNQAGIATAAQTAASFLALLSSRRCKRSPTTTWIWRSPTVTCSCSCAPGTATPWSTAYVADLGPGKLVVIDTRRTSSTVTLGSYGTDPFTAAATRHAVYVTNQGANTLSVIDPRTLTVVATVKTGTSPYAVAALPGKRKTSP